MYFVMDTCKVFLLRYRQLCFVVAVLCFFAPRVSAASGLEVAPPQLAITVRGTSVTARLEVKNPTADVQLFTVSLDGAHPDVAFRPASFTLEAGRSQTVFVEAKSGSEKSISDVVSVVATPLKYEGAQAIGGGVKIPLTVRFESAKPWHRDSVVWVKVLGVLLFALLAFWVGRRRTSTA